MQVYINCPGDESVGIPDECFYIDLPGLCADEVEQVERAREWLGIAFGEIYDTKCRIYMPGEFEDYE